MRYYQLTVPSRKLEFHQGVADRINNDEKIKKKYPNAAEVVSYGGKFHVRVTEDYIIYCRDYVLANCRIKPEETRMNEKKMKLPLTASCMDCGKPVDEDMVFCRSCELRLSRIEEEY
jgi:hypothetical protein